MTDSIRSGNQKLYQQQTDFIQSFLVDDAPAYQRLIAPPGLGKMAIAKALIRSLVREKGAKKILYIVESRIIADMFGKQLINQDFSILIEYVDVKKYREMVAESPIGASPWPESILVMIHPIVASTRDIRESIVQTKWDLVIADQVTVQKSRSKILELLLENKMAGRVLVFDRPGEGITKKDYPYLYKQFETTRWKYDFKDAISPSPIQVDLQVIEYQRSSTEITFIKKYNKVKQLAKDTPFAALIDPGHVSSSLYAAEQSIGQIRNKLVHQKTLSFLDDEIGLEEEFGAEEKSSSEPSTKKSVDSAQLVEAIQGCLDTLNLVSTDSKFDAFSGYFSQYKHGDHILILSDNAATTSFLYSNLEMKIKYLYQVSSMVSGESINDTFRQFTINGGVIILSSDHAIGVDLQVDEIILYDLPINSDLFPQIVGRLYRSDSLASQEGNIQKKLVIFQDTTKAIPTEEQRLRKLEVVFQQLSN